MKNKKTVLVISSIVILLPILFGLIFWNSLPSSMNTHWGIDGSADGSMGKAMAVFALPLILLAAHWICIWAEEKFEPGDGQNKKIRNLTYWMIPVISLFTNGAIYAGAFEVEYNISKLLLVFMGCLFIVIGNYLPKCKQNFTMGIKVKWTLANTENWNVTHRFAGKLWVLGGAAMFLCMLLPEKLCFGFMIAIILLMVIIPTVYSFLYYKKQVKEGRADKKPKVDYGKLPRKMGVKTVIVIAIIAIITVGVILMSDFDVKLGDDSIEINAFGWNDLSVEYSVIESVELRDDFDIGSRNMGYGGISLYMGKFRNDELGYYTLYYNDASKKVILIKADGKYLAITADNTNATEKLYDSLIEKIGK